jgi:RNA polymerase sigma-B factor
VLYPRRANANREPAAIITALLSSPPPRRSREGDSQALFLELRAGVNPGARAALVEQHLELARRLAGRYRHSQQPREDLEQVASLALVKAVDGNDPTRGPSFAAYAVPTILGELKRHMRDATWDVHVPRTLKERVLAIEQAERRLAARSGKPPTVADLAAEAGATQEQVLEALAARGAHDALPLDAHTSEGEGAGPGAPEPAAAEGDFRDLVEDRMVLSRALRGLHRRERELLALRFVDGLTQSEIAARVGLSQMHVSRLLRVTLQRLRDEID